MHRGIAQLLLFTLLAWGAPVHAEEEESTGEPSPAARALARDLARIVSLQEQTGWGIDHYEYESMLPKALQSLCRAPADARPEAEAILDVAIDALGGDPAALLAEPDVTLGDIGELLNAWRTGELMARALRHADRCPFWMTQSASFRGLHADEGRWSLHLEGGGLLVGRVIDDELRFGAGGGGRLTVGYGFSESWDLRAGLGFGGGALADRTVEAENIDIDFFMDMPIVLRHSGVLWRQEIEVAPMANGIPWQGPMQLGLRVGGLIGVGYLRVHEVMPWAGLGVYAEYSFAQDGMPEFWTLRMGVRVGVSWSSLGD